ncbi:hypothetical protein [Methylobacterium marchantiae]|uniref:Uncharacterized protein n=1 Tax=Methylobacterium marchantiae TaxID=600331 RepID=A0ABW3X1Y3_9HYPH|nr:hypothetical protein AIGOOFII_2794 [Methylobacterium marchantiae]
MESSIIRIVKPIAVAIITFVSCYYLTTSFFVAGVISLVPLLLGWLGIFAGFSYTIAALIFIAAVVWSVTPGEMKRFVRQNADMLSNELAGKMPPAPPRDPVPQEKPRDDLQPEKPKE